MATLKLTPVSAEVTCGHLACLTGQRYARLISSPGTWIGYRIIQRFSLELAENVNILTLVLIWTRVQLRLDNCVTANSTISSLLRPEIQVAFYLLRNATKTSLFIPTSPLWDKQ